MVVPEFFGQRVKSLRREMGLTQDELARRVGCAPVTLRKIEYDDLRPSVQIAERLAMALNIPLEARPDFVRQARLERVALDEPASTPTPRLEEIGFEDLSGRAIRGYALGERIGTGGMGVVYRAVQPLVEREVAIKIILPKYANHPEFIRRFEAEAQLVARLEHPHIVPLYDYWREPNVAYLVMRLLRGGSLQKLLEEGPLPLDLTLRVMEQIGSALSTAHRAGVIHRDLKPANILLDEDQNAYLADFGIAKNLGNLTQADIAQSDNISKSPAYVSPEQIRSEFVRPQSDIYCLGVVLYEMLTGRTPFQGPTPLDILHQHLSTQLPPLAVHKIGLPRTLDAVIEHATVKDPLARYPDVESLLVDLRRAIRGQEIASTELVTAPEQSPLTAADNPYKGLRAFVEGDAADFFGREALIQQLLVRMGEGGDLSRLLLVVGPSGSGKSSVVKAGLIPSLRRGALPGSESWYIVDLLPGSHPFDEIESALLRIAVNPPTALLEQLKQDKRGLLRTVQRCLPEGDYAAEGAPIELVLVIDQFEELFTLVEDEAERSLFLDSLATAVLDERSQLRVVLTLRADFTDRPLQYVDFGEICRQRVEMVLPMTPDELEQAIACPAERVGLVIEPDLVAAIVHDVEGQPGALPLLEYALTELFDLREGRLVTKAAYDRIGGVLGALGRRAEEGYAALDEPGKEATRQLFLRLVTLGEGTEDTRRRVARTELDTLQNTNPDIANYPSPINQVVETFGRARLLSFDRDPITRGPTLEVAHEALLHEWPRLRDWLANSREDVRMQRLLAGETGEWLRGGRDPSFLLSGTRLAQFEAWAGESAVALTLDERAYLDTSLQERQRQNDEETARQQRELEAARKLADIERQRAEEQFSAAKRLRRRAWVLVGMVGIGLILAIIAILFAQQARNNASHAQKAEAGALENLAKSEAQRLAAESNRLSIEGHSSEVAALLALRSLGLQYTVQGDEALSRASRQVYPLHVLNAADDVRGIAFNGDGTQIVTNSNDDEVRLWDVASGQLLRTFHGEIGTPNSVDISSDGRYVAALGNNVVVWDPNTGRELLSIDNTLILTNSEGISITTAQGITLSYCFNIDISSDGNYLLVGHKDGTARIWEISTGKEVQRFPGHLGGPMSMVFSPDDRYVLASDNIADQEGIIEVRLWDADTAELLHIFAQHRDVVQGLAFSPDGKTIFTASYDMSACFWDVESGQLIRCTHPGTSLIFNAAFSPDGRYALTGGADGVARLWEVSTGQVIHRYSQSGSIGGVAFSPDGKMVATASFDGTACIWTTEASLVQKEFTVPGITINYFSFSPDGRSIAAGVNDGMVRVWDVNTGQETLTFNGLGSPVWEASYSADGKVIFAASLSGLLFTWDASTGITLSQFTLPITAMVFADISPDGKTIVANNDFNHSYMIDAASGEVLKQFPKAFYCQTVAISPDGSRVALGITGGGAGISGQTWLFSYPGLEKLFMFDYPTDTCFTDMDFSSDGRLLLSAGALGNNDLVLWDMNTGKKLQQFTGFSKMQFGVALSPDGRYAAGAGFDNIARIWEIATGQEVRRLVGHSQALYGIDFSSDGKWVATSSMDGTLKLWYTNLEDLKAAMCKVLPRDLTAEERADYGIADNGPTCPKFANLSSGTP